MNPIVYWLSRAVLQPFFHLYFRLSRIGREHIPESGPVIFASNHRSFLDPFILGDARAAGRSTTWPRRSCSSNRLAAWFLNSLGAFPVERGAGDSDMLETAKAILARGDSVLIFPEGTRIRPGALGRPKRGVGRLALETGAPVVPVADDRHRGDPQGLAHPPAEGPRPDRPAAHLPAGRRTPRRSSRPPSPTASGPT